MQTTGEQNKMDYVDHHKEEENKIVYITISDTEE